MATILRSRSSRSVVSSSASRIAWSVAATALDTGRPGGPPLKRCTAASVCSAEDDAHTARDFPVIDVDAIVAEVGAMHVHAEPGSPAPEKPDPASDVVRDLHLV